MSSIIIRSPDDFHLHLRDGVVLSDTVKASAMTFSRALIMPNLQPPILNTKDALEYYYRIVSALPNNSTFKPLMTLYLSSETTIEDLILASKTGIIKAVKLYPVGATTHSNYGIKLTELQQYYPIFECMAEYNMVLCIHGEVPDQEVDIFDRESIFIEQYLKPLVANLPNLKIVFEHITTKNAVDFVINSGSNLGATVTVQHLFSNRNDLFKNGLQPHNYCLPILKTENDRQALISAVTSENNKFFAGTDSAPHAKNKKEMTCGCAGCYTSPVAVVLYTELFDMYNSLDKLEGFLSENGAKFYGLELNSDFIEIKKEEWIIPSELKFGSDIVVPYKANYKCKWKVIEKI
jgi:dihydroorotase